MHSRSCFFTSILSRTSRWSISCLQPLYGHDPGHGVHHRVLENDETTVKVGGNPANIVKRNAGPGAVHRVLARRRQPNIAVLGSEN